MMLPEVALLALLAWLLYAGIGTLAVPPAYVSTATPTEGAIRVARERMARGELDREDFDRIVRVLSG